MHSSIGGGMVALVLAIDTVTYTFLYCVVIPECNLKLAREILNTMLLIISDNNFPIYHNTSYVL